MEVFVWRLTWSLQNDVIFLNPPASFRAVLLRIGVLDGQEQ